MHIYHLLYIISRQFSEACVYRARLHKMSSYLSKQMDQFRSFQENDEAKEREWKKWIEVQIRRRCISQLLRAKRYICASPSIQRRRIAFSLVCNTILYYSDLLNRPTVVPHFNIAFIVTTVLRLFIRSKCSHMVATKAWIVNIGVLLLLNVKLIMIWLCDNNNRESSFWRTV